MTFITDVLVRKIEVQISTIYKSKNNLEYQYEVIKQKYIKLKGLIGEVQKEFKAVEQIYR